MSKHDKSRDSLVNAPRWQSLLLVCKDCRRRKNGPRHLKAKALASDIKPFMKSAAPNGRIVLTTCLKLCPKDATAVALIDTASTARIVAIESSEQLEKTLQPLFANAE